MLGLDAGRQIDHFYTAPPVREARALPPMPEGAPSDWDAPPVPASTNAIGSPDQASRAERAFFRVDADLDGSDLGAIDRAVEQAGSVRVHRGRHVPRARLHDVGLPDAVVQADAPAAPPPPTT